MRLILGSQSPRRREILGYFALDFDAISPDFDEKSLAFDGDPVNYVKALAEGKGASFQKPDDLILTADTIVYRNGQIFHKPRDAEEGFGSLRSLAGHTHSVFTGVSVRQGDRVMSEVEKARVTFNPLSDEQIRGYQSALHCADKAGGYAIQGAGGLIVRRIEGCFTNVMGLPIQTVNRLLEAFGLSLWDHLKDGEAR